MASRDKRLRFMHREGARRESVSEAATITEHLT
jgi:hypothetical protein